MTQGWPEPAPWIQKRVKAIIRDKPKRSKYRAQLKLEKDEADNERKAEAANRLEPRA